MNVRRPDPVFICWVCTRHHCDKTKKTSLITIDYRLTLEITESAFINDFAATKATLMGAGYVCEGAPADNLPHKDAAGVGDADVSFQRRPGGALGNCIDTGDSASDFVTATPAEPQNSTSAPTP